MNKKILQKLSKYKRVTDFLLFPPNLRLSAKAEINITFIPFDFNERRAVSKLSALGPSFIMRITFSKLSPSKDQKLNEYFSHFVFYENNDFLFSKTENYCF